MDWTLDGIPAHPLLVHAVVVLVPLAALAAVAVVVWPAARRRLGVLVPLLATASLASAGLAISAGEALEESVKETALVEAHTDMGETVLPWLIVFAIASWAFWAWHRFVKVATAAEIPAWKKAAPWVIAIALLAGAIGGTAQTFVVGHAGAKATWSQTQG